MIASKGEFDTYVAFQISPLSGSLEAIHALVREYEALEYAPADCDKHTILANGVQVSCRACGPAIMPDIVDCFDRIFTQSQAS